MEVSNSYNSSVSSSDYLQSSQNNEFHDQIRDLAYYPMQQLLWVLLDGAAGKDAPSGWNDTLTNQMDQIIDGMKQAVNYLNTLNPNSQNTQWVETLKNDISELTSFKDNFKNMDESEIKAFASKFQSMVNDVMEIVAKTDDTLPLGPTSSK